MWLKALENSRVKLDRWSQHIRSNNRMLLVSILTIMTAIMAHHQMDPLPFFLPVNFEIT